MNRARITVSFAAAALTACGTLAPVSSPVLGEVRSADGLAIRYHVHGTGEPALVLVHGWGNSSRIWGEHPRTLSQNHTVITLDLAGHGDSEVGRPAPTIGAFARDVAAVVDQVRPQHVVLVGFSMGADVVLAAAETLQDRVIGIIIVDDLHDPERKLTLADAAQLEAMFRANWRDTAFVRAFAFTPEAPDSLVRIVTEMMPSPREDLFDALRAAIRWRETELIPTLQRIRVPVAAIHTTRVPTNVEAMQRYLPSFTLDTIEDVGHAGILLQRVEDFDARILASVARFVAATPR